MQCSALLGVPAILPGYLPGAVFAFNNRSVGISLASVVVVIGFASFHMLFCRVCCSCVVSRQARHSYCWEDIRWNRTFASVVSRGEDGACEVDFSKFHDTVEVPKDCLDHGFVQSYA